MSKEKKEAKKVYNFDEKKEEYHSGLRKKLEVWNTNPKYLQSKTKAIELIESNKYGLDEGDFWILKNAFGKKGEEKMMYTGLIIAHNGCLKINDKLEAKMKFKPSCVETVKDEGEKVKVMKYVNDDQGVYEFGEISPSNCRNDYPYAMVLKRLMDRVILKNSKIGFFGIYSDSESEDFKQQDNEAPKTIEPQTKQNQFQKLASAAEGEMEGTQRLAAEDFFKATKYMTENCISIEAISTLFDESKKGVNSLEKRHKDLYDKLMDCKLGMEEILGTENINLK